MSPKAAAKGKPAKRTGKAKGPGRKAPARNPRIIRHRLVWQGVTLALRYEPRSSCSDEHSLLELKVVRPQGVPLPITATGNWSHFLPRGEVEEGGGPESYVCRLLDQEAASQAYRHALARWRQLELF
ncbi:MAG: hypothetical protein QOK17_2692 [Sphingomonadales bacterium]|jgi:hypothetical protein|nr:hypothetical protein [Sphingomonadales bacterium]